METKELVNKALKVRENAYAPYSKFRVGAAVLTQENEVYTGCNIENSSYGATCCAEQVAIFKAVSEGRRNFRAIAIGSDASGFTYPCGICRQVIVEFQIPKIIVSDRNGNYKEYSIKELMPYAFDNNSIAGFQRKGGMEVGKKV